MSEMSPETYFNMEVGGLKELALNDVFTIENKRDPFWEKEAKKIIEKLVHSLSIVNINSGVPVSFSKIVAQLKNKNISELEEFFREKHIELPTATNTRHSVLAIIKEKLNRVVGNINLDEVAASVLKIDFETAKNNKKKVEGLDAYFYWDNRRGGYQAIISQNGEKLVAGSATNYDKLVEEFKNGRRN